MHNYVRKNKLFTNTGSASIGLPKVGASASIKRLLAPIEADASTTFSTIIKVNVGTKRTIKKRIDKPLLHVDMKMAWKMQNNNSMAYQQVKTFF